MINLVFPHEYFSFNSKEYITLFLPVVLVDIDPFSDWYPRDEGEVRGNTRLIVEGRERRSTHRSRPGP